MLIRFANARFRNNVQESDFVLSIFNTRQFCDYIVTLTLTYAHYTIFFLHDNIQLINDNY